jgi:polyisoprenoid-binding protein YceI
MSLISSALAEAPATTPGTPAGTWNLDPVHSSIGFTVLYMGVAPFEGAFREVEATLTEDGLIGTAQASSIDVADENLAGHLAARDFFDAAAFPTLGFESGALVVSDQGVTVDGTLEIKANRVPVTLSGTITDPVTDPWGNEKLGLTLSTTVDRRQFGLEWNAPLPDGGEMLANEVELTARLVFVARKDA